jgi:hypothetical protein
VTAVRKVSWARWRAIMGAADSVITTYDIEVPSICAKNVRALRPA